VVNLTSLALKAFVLIVKPHGFFRGGRLVRFFATPSGSLVLVRVAGFFFDGKTIPTKAHKNKCIPKKSTFAGK